MADFFQDVIFQVFGVEDHLKHDHFYGVADFLVLPVEYPGAMGR